MFLPALISAVVFWGLALGGGFYWARRYVRAVEQRVRQDATIAGLEERIRELEAREAKRLPSAT